MSLVLGPHNAMLRGTAEMDRTPPRMSALEGQGYSVFPIDELTVVNANPFARHPDPPLRWLADSGQFDAVLSGADTRLVSGRYPRPPNGPVYRNGAIDTEGNGRSAQRGTVAVLTDRSIVMGRAHGASARELNDRFGRSGAGLHSALGGGALLLEHGRFVDHLDLMMVQLFDDGRGGLQALTMQRGVHTIMGIRQGRAYAAWCNGRSAIEIRRDFRAAGFSTLIKFAHGSSVFYDDCIDRFNGQNGAGFGMSRAY
ncbi:MAG: hypothetical protein VX127_14490 [Myxococcota bacterium]|nr:hypothetical protein [Myxococcota bacterium]